MIKYKGIKWFLNQLRNSDRSQQQQFLNELTASIHLLTTTDLQVLLEFLTIIHDFDLEIKLFSLLSVCVVFNDSYYEIIISFNPIYEKLENILSRGLCLKTTVIFNFLTVLLSKDVDVDALSRKQLASRARNMVRVSGCLRWMISFFMNSMVFLDTWQALCQCLAECCRDSPINKDQCSHLVPVCINKCLQGITDVLVVLQSLLNDYPKNVQNFIKCNGFELFKKENLQLSACLQLLTTVSQNPDFSSMITATEVPDNIAEILHWSGPQSQRGQWCTIILYYLNYDKNKLRQRQNLTSKPTQDAPIIRCTENVKTKELSVSAKNVSGSGSSDTGNLLRNVMQEVLNWKTNERASEPERENTKLQSSPRNLAKLDEDINDFFKDARFLFETKNTLKRAGNTFQIIHDLRQDKNKELSFSFLEQETPPQNTSIQTAEILKESTVTHNFTLENNQHCIAKAFNTTNRTVGSGFDYNYFRPKLTSSPKRDTWTEGKHDFPRERTRHNVKLPRKTSSCMHTRPAILGKRIQRPRYSPFTKAANLSMTAKLFGAVNETCTTIVKTVKDVFMPWKKGSANETKDTRKPSNLSFMEYMRKRDALLGCSELDEPGEIHIGIERKDMSLCATCNDTRMLKEKLASDEQLKTTVKKLKLGINLYGCDFKKISKALWPNEIYMTPTVLYNLYRKLILK